MSKYKGPLSDFTVIDLCRVRSGPTAVRQLADWGANVIKIEAPEAIDQAKGMGGARLGPDFQNVHRNKRGMTLNLKSAEGIKVLKDMVKKADVVVENFRPDVKERLGIDYHSLKQVNPKIIFGSISGFGQDGPYSKRPGFDQIAQGMGGLMSITGIPDQGPVRVGIPIADLTSGMYCAIGILIALLEREKSGEGQWVQTSLLQAQISMLDFQAARWLVNREVPHQAGNNHPTSIPTGVFKTKNSYINIAASGDDMWDRLCEVLDSEKISQEKNFSSAELRSQHRDELNKQIELVTIMQTSEYWINKLADVSVPCGPIYSIDQVFDDPQVKHLGMEHPVKHPQLGDINLVGQPIKMSRFESRTGKSTPNRGEDTDEILLEMGYDINQINALRTKKVL